MEIRVCDICENPTKTITHKITIKHRWFSWHEEGWSRLDICDSCAERILYTLKMESDKNET